MNTVKLQKELLQIVGAHKDRDQPGLLVHDLLTAFKYHCTEQTGTNPLVMESLRPTDDEISAKVEEYGFRVPYDGSNKFYDDEAIKHFRSGAEWARGFGGMAHNALALYVRFEIICTY